MEREQNVSVFDQFGDGFLVFHATGCDEDTEGGICFGLRLGLPYVVKVALGFVEDVYVRERLVEAWKRCCDTGCAGMVVHSNQVREFERWQNLDIHEVRQRVVETLSDVMRSGDPGASCWLGLENMPVMDNYCNWIIKTLEEVQFGALLPQSGEGFTACIQHDSWMA